MRKIIDNAEARVPRQDGQAARTARGASAATWKCAQVGDRGTYPVMLTHAQAKATA